MDKCKVHDCTGPDQTCPCGYKLTFPRFVVSLDVYDNQTKTQLVNECFSSDDVTTAVDAMEDAIEKLGA
jgi:hypothetical protein